VLCLLLLVIGLAAATVWFVVLPTLDKPPTAKRTCEVFVLRSGATKCVPTPGLRAVSKGAKHVRRPKH
jgi:hypothetical protein